MRQSVAAIRAQKKNCTTITPRHELIMNPSIFEPRHAEQALSATLPVRVVRATRYRVSVVRR
ncbi:hypothetical protein [Pseudomonas reidholzensis]|uniref:hypothetical protein n=1 Tax=Pseudomonas reidholzensis TaxID=1785162 RepID=UPI0039EDFED5